MANPNDPHHAALEAEIIACATTYAWVVGSATYHTVMADPVVLALQRCWDPAALYIRGRADRVAVKDQRCVLFEAKTNSGCWPRGAFEALPIRHYIRVGVPCLYVYRDMKDGFEAAFWTTAMPAIDVIFLPDQWAPSLLRYFRDRFQEMWPDVEVLHIPAVNGSNDPYLVLSRASMQAVGVDWRAVFSSPRPADTDRCVLVR
jgi:hypothetical protein